MITQKKTSPNFPQTVMNSKLSPHKNDNSVLWPDKYTCENIISIHNIGQENKSNVRIFKEGKVEQGHGEATTKIYPIASIFYIVNASDFLSQKDYCRTGEGQKKPKVIGWFLYKEQLSWLEFFLMEEEKLWRETTGIYKTIRSQDNSGWKRPQEISKSDILHKAGPFMRSHQDTDKVMRGWREWTSCRCSWLPPF